MNRSAKIAIVTILVILVAVVFALKQGDDTASPAGGSDGGVSTSVPATATAPEDAEAPEPTGALPRLVDLGADKCIPCKMMAPILEEFEKAYAGRLRVDFIDVWKNPSAGKTYGIRMIPTQIFYDASGKELFRHEGFFSKEDILAKWKEFGVDLAGTGEQDEALARANQEGLQDRGMRTEMSLPSLRDRNMPE